jgi:hypothetical protein
MSILLTFCLLFFPWHPSQSFFSPYRPPSLSLCLSLLLPKNRYEEVGNSRRLFD